jgi:hypothetical protein
VTLALAIIAVCFSGLSLVVAIWAAYTSHQAPVAAPARRGAPRDARADPPQPQAHVAGAAGRVPPNRGRRRFAHGHAASLHAVRRGDQRRRRAGVRRSHRPAGSDRMESGGWRSMPIYGEGAPLFTDGGAYHELRPRTRLTVPVELRERDIEWLPPGPRRRRESRLREDGHVERGPTRRLPRRRRSEHPSRPARDLRSGVSGEVPRPGTSHAIDIYVVTFTNPPGAWRTAGPRAPIRRGPAHPAAQGVGQQRPRRAALR